MPFSKLFPQRSVHGSISPAELRAVGLNIEDVLDFSANINPLGISPVVRQAIADADVARYPDPDCLQLREALARATGVDSTSVIAGNGSTEIIHLLARAWLTDGGAAVVLTPTFGEYELACQLTGTQPITLRAREEDDFRWDIADACRHIEQVRPRLVFLCNPNNPSGTYLNREWVQRIAEAATPGTLIIDEAYVPFVEEPWDATALLEMGNVVLLRSMTKDHALAGVRLGYALGPAEVLDSLKIYQPFWSVNAVAQAAGLAAITDRRHVAQAKKIVTETRAYLHTALEKMGAHALPASANFLLVKVGDARSIRTALLKRGLCVRDCTSFGLPQYIRIAVRTLPECRKLVTGFREVYHA